MPPVISLPPPSAFGLPEKFVRWRPDQITAFQQITDCPARFLGLTMPTGSGKGLTYMTAAHLSSGRVVVLTAKKGLQDQLFSDFQGLGLTDVRGLPAYGCLALSGDGEWSHLNPKQEPLTCDRGPCQVGLPCTLREAGCTHYDAVRSAMGARLVSTNYACWLARRRWSTGLGSVDLLVLDEAHRAMEELSEALTLKLEKWLLSSVGIKHPSPGYSLMEWRTWASSWILRIRGDLEGMPPTYPLTAIKHRQRLQSVERTLPGIAQMIPGDWVEDSTPDAYVFEALWPARYSEQLLFQGAKRVVLTSATLTGKTLSLLGLPDAERTLWECPSRFPVARRAVYRVPTVRVDKRMKHEHRVEWLARIDQILSVWSGVKGIIHTVSYLRAQEIYQGSRYQSRLVIPPKGEVSQTVEWFKQQSEPKVLLSPALGEGWDFPHDQCRLQIVSNLPFPDGRSHVLQAREEQDPEYGPHLMIQALEQSVGRGMREDNDWCVTFIIDDHWKWVRGKYKHLMTDSFRQAVKEVKTIPPPIFPT